MKKLIVSIVLMILPLQIFASELSAEEIIKRSQKAFYYSGDTMKARVAMQLIDRDGRSRSRLMSMLRRNETEGSKQKYFIYFHEPGDVRRMTFMVWKDLTKEDQRWIFIPAVDLVRRIAADDKHSSFVGSDFTYEDISGRDISTETHKLLKEETLNGRGSYVIQSIARQATENTKRISWIDKQSFLPLKEEYYDLQEELSRVFTSDKIEQVTGWPTTTHRTMKNIKTGHRTEVKFESIVYDLVLKDSDFSERRMRRPPRAWIQ